MKNLPSFTRRKFLEQAFTATVLSAFAPGLILGKVIPTLNRSKTGVLGIYQLDINHYPVLKEINGSVRLQISGLQHKVLVTRMDATTFAAVSEVCTHSGCAIDDLNPSTLRFTCPCHGSQFAADGKRLQGPATRNLDTYTTLFDGDTSIQVEIAGISSAPISTQTESFLAPILSSSQPGVSWIRYGLAQSAHTLVTLYSIAGQKIRRLVDDKQEAGVYEIPIDCSALVNGVYICRLQTTGRFTATQKFIVTR